MKKIFTLAAAMFMAIGAVSAQDHVYVIGEVNDQSWNPTTGIEMTAKGNNVFEATVDVKGYFGFTMALSEDPEDWNTVNENRLYPEDGIQMITLDADNQAVIALAVDKNGGDSWTLGDKVDGVTFTIDLEAMTLTVKTDAAIELDPNIYVIGGYCGWSFDNATAMTEVEKGVKYEIKDFTVTGGFKLANNGWAPNNVGAAWEGEGEEATNTWPIVGEPYAAFNDGGSGNLVINNEPEKEFNVNITLTFAEAGPVVLIEDAAGVADINADNNAVAEYFNLQGMKVANPENGLYIVRRGANVTKVLVK